MRAITIGLIVLLVCLGTVLTGCITETEATEVVEEGTIEVFVTTTRAETDTPTELEISSIMAKISEIKIYREKVDEEGEWVNLYVAKAPLDLLQDSDDKQFLAFIDAEDSSTYTQFSLVLERLEVTLSEGSEIVITPEEPFEFIGNFAVFGGRTTTVVFNFEIDRSVVIEEDKTSIKPLSEITWKIRYEQSD